jgi:hypothetical protein
MHYYPGRDVKEVSIKMFFILLSRMGDIDERTVGCTSHREYVERAARRRREE